MKTYLQHLFILFILIALSQPINAQTYVNSNATGNNDGSSWTDAYGTYLIKVSDGQRTKTVRVIRL